MLNSDMPHPRHRLILRCPVCGREGEGDRTGLPQEADVMLILCLAHSAGVGPETARYQRSDGTVVTPLGLQNGTVVKPKLEFPEL